MSNIDISIGEAELEIMKVIWEKGGKATTGDITKAVEEKGWKRTTISTFLSRLVEKGALCSEKVGNFYHYTALISKKDYTKSKTRSLIQSLYDGSAKSLAASLFEDGGLTKSDIEELRAIFTREKSDD